MSLIYRAPRAAPLFSRAVIGLVLAAFVGLHASETFADQALPTGFVFTANEDGGNISRIDLESDTVQEIPLPIMPHNVDVSAKGELVFVVGLAGHEGASSQAMMSTEGPGSMMGMAEESPPRSDMPRGKLAVLSLASLAAGPIALVNVGRHPAHVVPDLDSKRVFVSDSETDSISIVDLATRTVVKTISTGDYPHGLRLSPDGRELVVANVEDGSVSVIDVATLKESGRIPVGAAPVQVGFTPDGTRIYVSLRDENAVAVIDRQSRTVLTKIAVERNPIQVHATPDGRFVYVANQGSDDNPDNRVSIIEVASNSVVKTLTVGAGAHGVAISPDGRFAYVTNIREDSVSVIDTAKQSVVKTIPVGEEPNGIAVLFLGS